MPRRPQAECFFSLRPLRALLAGLSVPVEMVCRDVPVKRERAGRAKSTFIQTCLQTGIWTCILCVHLLDCTFGSSGAAGSLYVCLCTCPCTRLPTTLVRSCAMQTTFVLKPTSEDDVGLCGLEGPWSPPRCARKCPVGKDKGRGGRGGGGPACST